MFNGVNFMQNSNMEKKIQTLVSRFFKKSEKERNTIIVEVKTTLKDKTIILKHKFNKVNENEIRNEVSLFEKDKKKIESEDLCQLFVLFGFCEDNKIISDDLSSLQREKFGEVNEEFFIKSCDFIAKFFHIPREDNSNKNKEEQEE